MSSIHRLVTVLSFAVACFAGRCGVADSAVAAPLAETRRADIIRFVFGTPSAPSPLARLGLRPDNLRLGLRSYVGVRVGSEQTDLRIQPTAGGEIRSLTFPVSAAGHVRQMRAFVELELDHNLDPLIENGFPMLNFLRHLPFRVSGVRYHLTYRGEGEGIYDWGPREFSTSTQFQDQRLVRPLPRPPPISQVRRRLRRIGVQRHRLFEAFLEFNAGDLFVRFGRQILAWGETDGFRLLDNINPIDASFGGFLVPLDERRVPLNMLVANYPLPAGRWIHEAFVEGFVSVDNDVSFSPGIPQGSPWMPPNLGAPSGAAKAVPATPARTLGDARFGGRVSFLAALPFLRTEASFTLAHYWTYFDLPAVRVKVQPNFPVALPDGPGKGFLTLARQSAPRGQVTGGAFSFTLPAYLARSLGLGGEPVIRAELAYFHGESRPTQGSLDPFIFKILNGKLSGGQRTGDSWNLSVGVDLNRFIRVLNHHNSFFLSTQFFYKHLNAAVKRRPIMTPAGCALGTPGCSVLTYDGEVLPVPELVREQPPVIEPIFVHNPVDQFLQTLAVSTSYAGGQVNPLLVLFYDWGGAVVVSPGVTFIHDPFRLTLSYNYLEAGRLKGGSGVSLLRDRDNVLAQLEFVL